MTRTAFLFPLLILTIGLCSCGGGGGVITKVTALPQVVTLYAGQTDPVGHIEISDDGSSLTVKYVIDTPNWALTETHLHVALADDGDGIPQKNGNPIPGKFAYKQEHNYVTTYTYVVPIPAGATVVDIAAHASAEVATQLMLNEGFEDPMLPSPLGVFNSSGWDVFDNSEIPAWDVIDMTAPDAGTDGNLEYWRDIELAIGRPDGAQLVELDSDGHPFGNNVRITQNLTGLSDNCFLSFYWRPRVLGQIGTEYDCQMVVNFNGADLGTFNPANWTPNAIGGNWEYEVLPLNTTGLDNAPLFFEETGFQGGSGGLGTLLDAVSVLSYGDGETAWSTGAPFGGSNWATYTVYTIGSGTE